MLNKSGNSRMDTLLKVVLIFVMSILSFSIGAFVGKQVSDTEYRQALLESEHGQSRSTASINPNSTDLEHEKALSEEDIASLTEEFVRVEKKALVKEEALELEKLDEPGQARVEEQHEDHEQKGYKKLNKKMAAENAAETVSHNEVKHKALDKMNKMEEPSMAAQRVAKNMAPEKDPAPKREPSRVLPTTPASSIGKYTVQIASYATEDEAKKHALELKAKGYSAFYIPAEIRRQTWYRVSVGLFTNYNSAMAFRKELQSEAGIQSTIIQKIVK